MSITVAAIQAEIDAYVARLDMRRARRAPYVASEVDRDAGYPFFRVEGDLLVYAARERGRETMRQETSDPDELVFWVISDVARELAIDREARRRRRGRDGRRQWFADWEARMRRLRPDWGDRVHAHVEDVLRRSPYRDGRP